METGLSGHGDIVEASDMNTIVSKHLTMNY